MPLHEHRRPIWCTYDWYECIWIQLDCLFHLFCVFYDVAIPTFVDYLLYEQAHHAMLIIIILSPPCHVITHLYICHVLPCHSCHVLSHVSHVKKTYLEFPCACVGPIAFVVGSHSPWVVKSRTQTSWKRQGTREGLWVWFKLGERSEARLQICHIHLMGCAVGDHRWYHSLDNCVVCVLWRRKWLPVWGPFTSNLRADS